MPESEAFNSYIGDGFLNPELKDESEVSEDEQADCSSENNVGNGALFVIGLHRSGGAVAHFLQDWETARLGGGKGSPELPYSIRYAMPTVI